MNRQKSKTYKLRQSRRLPLSPNAKKKAPVFREKIIGSRLKTEGSDPERRIQAELATKSTIQSIPDQCYTFKLIEHPIHSRLPRLSHVRHGTAFADCKSQDKCVAEAPSSLEIQSGAEAISIHRQYRQSRSRLKYNMLDILQERRISSYVTGTYKMDIYDQYIHPEQPENIPVVLNRAFFPINMPRRPHALAPLPLVHRSQPPHCD